MTIRSASVPVRAIIIGMIVFVVVLFVLSFSSQFFYFFERVNPDEVGVQFVGGRIKGVVGPGVYSDIGLFVEMKHVSSQAIQFSVSDEELITKDKQRIGVLVTGDIFRPSVEDADLIQRLWPEYNQLYLAGDAARVRIEDRARQAMKVCVGNRSFDENVIGSGRDDLKECIDDELNKLAENYGLFVANVAVPNVILSPEVQARLDEIVQSRLETEKAGQDKLKAEAQAAAEQARQQGEIRIAQSRIQEESRQQKILAELEREKIESQRAVIEAERANELARVEAQRAIIEAEKSNELLAAERDLEIESANALAAAEAAKATVAQDAALAAIYAANPGLLQLELAQANASALRTTDKIIFTADGMVPTLVMPGPGIVPTTDVTSVTP
jgi:regulator of protease activity HflC (stomatin/prohibitin superfamily)